MIKTRLSAFLAAALLSLGIAAQANQAEVKPETRPEAGAATVAPEALPNFFDPNYWVNTLTGTPVPGSEKLKFNAAHPADWMKWVDPKEHKNMHMTFMNPATYTQFMQPKFYMEFTKPQNLAAWMDFNQYAVMWDPQTMGWWMNPAAYMHVIDPTMYTAAMDPANYMVYMNPATYMGWANMQTCDQNNPNGGTSWFGVGC